jgi:actin-like ATPase involved in cell morphogenesis
LPAGRNVTPSSVARFHAAGKVLGNFCAGVQASGVDQCGAAVNLDRALDRSWARLLVGATLTRMSSGGYALGIDFGTSSTVAVLRWPNGRVQPLLFDGSPLLPSAVFAPRSGQLIVGRDALHHGRFEPALLEPHPKRRVDEGAVLLGGREVAVVEMFAAVMRRVAVEAARVTGGPVPAVAVTCPAGWAGPRRAVLAEAASHAGLGDVAMVAEPVAAAARFGGEVPVGRAVVVYDLGAGTFDASVVVRSASGYEVAAFDGLDDVGGLDLDGAVVAWLRERAGFREPADPQARRMLWDEVRVAKEMLSTTSAVTLRNNAIGLDTRITREEFEAAVQPLLDRTVHMTVSTVRLAGCDVAAVLRVGGGSRIPLAATLLHRATGIASHGSDQPELIVAEGALQCLPATQPVGPPAGATTVVALPVAAQSVAEGPSGGGRRKVGVLVGAVILLLLLAGGGFGVYKILDRSDHPDGSGRLSAAQQRLLDSMAGHWTSTFYGECYIRIDNGVFRMIYTYRDGRVYAELSGDKLVGWWNQAETGTEGQKPEGQVEFTISRSGGRQGLDGRWRFGTAGAWVLDWHLTYVDADIPPDLAAKFDDASRFKKGP